MHYELYTAPHKSEQSDWDVMRIACSPDRKTIAFADADGQISIFDASWKWVSTLEHDKAAPISELAFSPDGKVLACTSRHSLGRRNTITIFDLAARQTIGPSLRSHQVGSSGIVFGDQGKAMFSADDEGVIFRWNLDVDSWKNLAVARAGRGITEHEAKEYLDEDTPPPVLDPQTLLKLADTAALNNAPEARALFGEAVKVAIAGKDPEASNNVCWYGTVDGFADVVLPAGDSAVDVAHQAWKSYYCDTRGLARALAGRKQEAIEDFRAFISWAESNNLQHERVSKRLEWIRKLEKGEQPFTSEVLLDLRNESMPAPD